MGRNLGLANQNSSEAKLKKKMLLREITGASRAHLKIQSKSKYNLTKNCIEYRICKSELGFAPPTGQAGSDQMVLSMECVCLGLSLFKLLLGCNEFDV